MIQSSLVIPYDRAYVTSVHGEGSHELSDKIEREIIPYLCQKFRFSTDFTKIEIFTHKNSAFDSLQKEGLADVVLRSEELEQDSSMEQILRDYVNRSPMDSKMLVLANPLFPFVSLNTIEALLHKVASNEFETGCTFQNAGMLWKNGSPVNFSFEDNTPKYGATDYKVDFGALYVVRRENLRSGRSRITPPVAFCPLSSIESVTLRNRSDWPLVELILSSGIDKRS